MSFQSKASSLVNTAAASVAIAKKLNMGKQENPIFIKRQHKTNVLPQKNNVVQADLQRKVEERKLAKLTNNLIYADFMKGIE